MMIKDMTDKKWLLHLAAARSALVNALGFNSYEHYIKGVCRVNNFNKRAAECLRTFIPYCIQKLDEESGKVIVLNRDYKPIGYYGSYDGQCNYSEFDSAIADLESPQMQALISACGKDKAGRDWIWFTCNDSSVPWASSEMLRRMIGLIDVALNAAPKESDG
jgi:hypothetical protein